jgi:hypothetical protein
MIGEIFDPGSSKAVSQNRLLSDAIDPGRIAADLSAFPRGYNPFLPMTTVGQSFSPKPVRSFGS